MGACPRPIIARRLSAPRHPKRQQRRKIKPDETDRNPAGPHPVATVKAKPENALNPLRTTPKPQGCEICGLAEAKGTRHAVGFTTKEFQRWREQFDRVRVYDAQGQPRTLKGFIVAMRWAMETDSPKVSTTLSAEDPETSGVRPLADDGLGLAYAVKSIHYASSLQRLRQPLLSAALLQGFTIPDELQFRFVVWQSFLPLLEGRRFIGGYFPESVDGTLPFKLTDDGQILYVPADPLRLDISSGTFFGIDERVFKILVATARRGPEQIGELRSVEVSDVGYSGISFLRDGHLLGPIEFFRPIDIVTM